MLTCVRHIEETTGMKRIIHAVVMALLLAPGVSWADDLRQQFNAGLEAYETGDYETACEIWLPLAERGDAEAQARLGDMFARGDGVFVSSSKSIRWYWACAEQGHDRAQFRIGSYYWVARDYAEAARWFLAAAEQGNKIAQYRLASMYKNGEGVAQNDFEAVRWYRSAAKQGWPNAEFNLGFMYYHGRGVRKNYASAARWYLVSAKKGVAIAQANLGRMYANGEGVIQDYSTAHMWLNIASREIFTDRDRERVEDLMAPEAIGEAQRRARICIQSGYEDCD